MKNSSKYYLGFTLLVFAGALAIPFVNGTDVSSFITNPLTWILGIALIFLILSLFAVSQAMEGIKYYILRKEGRLEELKELQEAEASGDDVFSRLWQKLQDAKPVEEESEIEMDHEYDGIRELDNNLPPWWLWGFYISIVFSVVYILRFEVLKTAPSTIDEYEQEMAAAEIAKEEYLKTAANLVDETSVVMLTDEALIKEGATIFSTNCAVCHATDGGGGVGPNLTDEYWLHGGDIKSVFATVKYGVPAKGMIPWKDQLNPGQMQKVSSYIMTLIGTTPADPKEPQGDKVTPVPQETQESMDSTMEKTEDETAEAVMSSL
ncbi:cbb3-type cytochrome c oxidase N-terminal domain-containing protein [Owenweeksia hongkongensis]|uniref:cbb3-type cytochrome c oxidase N-terminal domain-containing protein n=1 Tax=Owenweeksia hongkongensis TaxID=253245 RepID=UPI003A911798